MGFVKFTQEAADYYVDLINRLEKDIESIKATGNLSSFRYINKVKHKMEALEGAKKVLKGIDDQYDGFLINMYAIIHGRKSDADDIFLAERNNPNTKLYKIYKAIDTTELQSLRHYAANELQDLFMVHVNTKGLYLASKNQIHMQKIIKE